MNLTRRNFFALTGGVSTSPLALALVDAANPRRPPDTQSPPDRPTPERTAPAQELDDDDVWNAH